MKAIAMKNDPSRRFQDSADVRFLLTLPGIDRDEIRRFFGEHHLKSLFDEIEASV